MCIKFSTDEFPPDYVPPILDNYYAAGKFNGQSYELGLWDTGGRKDYYRFRPLSYPETDVFLLLFDVEDSRNDLELIYSHWWAELHHHCPYVPIILVGSKIDLRDSGLTTISTVEGEAMAKKIGAAKYMEISSLKDKGVTELFEEVVSIGLHYNTTVKLFESYELFEEVASFVLHYNTTVKGKKKKKRKCNIL